MRQTVIPKSDQLSSDDLIGRSLTIKITKVTGDTENAQQPVVFHYEGDNGKPYKPCKTMRRLIIHAWKHETKNYAGRSMTLYCDPEVQFGGMKVGGIRISHMSDIASDFTIALTSSKAKKKAVTVQRLNVAATASPPPPAASEDTLKAGAEASGKGVVAYTEWLASLSPEVKATIKVNHAAWSKVAKEFDAAQPKTEEKMDEEFSV